MNEKQKKRRSAILDLLRNSAGPVTGPAITEQLAAEGFQISERTVRIDLQELESEGLVIRHGRRGSVITEKGTAELEASRSLERVGFLSAKIDRMTYGMSFDLETRSGTVVLNTTIVRPEQLIEHADLICRVFERGYAMGHLVALFGPGERVGSQVVPGGMTALGTVCSITLNGVLLKHGVPTHSRFGGLLQLRDGEPFRFAEIIEYSGTSIDPLEVFIRSGMTDYIGAVTAGNGLIGASFREIPAESRPAVMDLADKLEHIGLGGFMCIGTPGRPLLDIPVNEGRAGAIVIGGLNPVAILEEKGERVSSFALSGHIEFSRLFHYTELVQRIRESM
jgi:hypothetical protein